MTNKQAAANVSPVRQRTQYTCMAASLMMCLRAHGVDVDEDTVNEVMGAVPMRGASWESAFAAAQHFGFRTHLVCPATLNQVKEWTDAGIPVMIAWNPEGREWSHASVVFDVDGDGNVSVADPNIPDPEQTVRIVLKDEFYRKWFEKFPNYLVRRTAMAVMREVTPDGRQVVAFRSGFYDFVKNKACDERKKRMPAGNMASRVVSRWAEKRASDTKAKSGISEIGKISRALELLGFETEASNGSLFGNSPYYIVFRLKPSWDVRSAMSGASKILKEFSDKHQDWNWESSTPERSAVLGWGIDRRGLRNKMAGKFVFASAEAYGIAMYMGKTDPQTGLPLVELWNSAVGRDIGTKGLIPEEDLLKIKRGVPFLVKYGPDDDVFQFAPLTRVH